MVDVFNDIEIWIDNIKSTHKKYSEILVWGGEMCIDFHCFISVVAWPI